MPVALPDRTLPDRTLPDLGELDLMLHETTRPAAAAGPTWALGASRVPTDGDGDGPDGRAAGYGGEGSPAPRGVPRGIAVVLVVLLAGLLTFFGMLSQIWANMSGAQLPGA
ncbi:MAG: hypothetical protein ACRDPT_17510 [Streptomycetales bacterium]